MKVPVISNRPEVQAHYEAMRRRGESHSISEMAATRVAPGARYTDRAFMQGRNNNEDLNEMPKFLTKMYVEKARKAGISISGKTYMSGLADGRGPADPEAWVSDTSDVLRVAKKRNLDVRGAVTHAGYDVPPKESGGLAEDIVQEEVASVVAKDPRKKLKLSEVREEVIAKHGAPKRGK